MAKIMDDANIAKVHIMRSVGFSYRAIGRYIGVSQETIRRTINKHHRNRINELSLVDSSIKSMCKDIALQKPVKLLDLLCSL